MDIAGLIDSFATGSYQVTRRAAAPFERGREQEGAATTFPISGSEYPISGRELQRLPEERRSNETRAIFTATQLLVGGQGAAFEADQVAIDGEAWEVQLVDTWKDPVSGSSGYRCVLQAAL